MTPRQLAVLDFVREHISRSGFAPTYSEICGRLGLANRSRAHALIESLIDQGFLKRTAYKARGLALCDRPDLRSVPADELLAELDRRGVTPGALSRHERPVHLGRAVTCSADGCSREVRAGHPFCLMHWRIIPPAVQTELFEAHRAAKATPRDRDALRRYQDAFTAAMLATERTRSVA